MGNQPSTMSPLGVTDPCGYKFDSGPAYWGRGESANTVLTTNFLWRFCGFPNFLVGLGESKIIIEIV